MKLVILVCLLAVSSYALPYVEQMTLANSLIVGREDQMDLTNWECKVCDSTNRPLHAHYIEEDVKDIKCVLSVYPTFVVLAFRYTNTLLNVWQDILYANQIVDSAACSGCKVQKAYKTMWESVKNNVTNDLKLIRQQTNIRQLYITGISLGGGLSVISFVDVFTANIFDSVKVITYGAPRVANKEWAAFFEAKTGGVSKRFIVKGDPITVLPECLTLLCNYKHTGIQYVCTEDDKICRAGLPVPTGLLAEYLWKKNADASMQNLGGLIDHIDGYPKIYNHTIIEK